jgi:hypothetical protein
VRPSASLSRSGAALVSAVPMSLGHAWHVNAGVGAWTSVRFPFPRKAKGSPKRAVQHVAPVQTGGQARERLELPGEMEPPGEITPPAGVSAARHALARGGYARCEACSVLL